MSSVSSRHWYACDYVSAIAIYTRLLTGWDFLFFIFFIFNTITAIAHDIYQQGSHKSLQKAPFISVSLSEHIQQYHRNLLIMLVLNLPPQVALLSQQKCPKYKPAHQRRDDHFSECFAPHADQRQALALKLCLGQTKETLGKLNVCIQDVYSLSCWCYPSHK